MKQKIVIKISINGQKSRSKAMRISAGFPGVDSAALGGQDKSQIEVTGDGIDAVELTTLLRKNVGHAEIVSVSAVEQKKVEKKEDPPKVQPVVWPTYVGGVTHYVGDGNYQQQPDPNSCSIM